MLYIILICFLLVPIILVVGLFYAYKKLTRSYFLLLLFTLIAGPFVAFKFYERGFMLSVVPDALHVTSISYSEEESWGFGPGGNEAGIRVYPLPERVANEILQRGMEFFDNLPPNQNYQNREWRGEYDSWHQTPISQNKYWKLKEETKHLDIYDYICMYGFCIDINPSVVKEADNIVNSDGSYYAYGRIGLIIISPSKRLVLYMYNG